MQGYPILNLFLLANLMTTTSTLPVLLGLLDGPIASRLFTPLSALFGCWFSFASIVVYGRIMLADWGGTMSNVSHVSSPSLPHLFCMACHLPWEKHGEPVRPLPASMTAPCPCPEAHRIEVCQVADSKLSAKPTPLICF